MARKSASANSAEAAWVGRAARSGSLGTAGRDGQLGCSLTQVNGKVRCGTPGYMAPEVSPTPPWRSNCVAREVCLGSSAAAPAPSASIKLVCQQSGTEGSAMLARTEPESVVTVRYLPDRSRNHRIAAGTRRYERQPYSLPASPRRERPCRVPGGESLPPASARTRQAQTGANPLRRP